MATLSVTNRNNLYSIEFRPAEAKITNRIQLTVGQNATLVKSKRNVSPDNRLLQIDDFAIVEVKKNMNKDFFIHFKIAWNSEWGEYFGFGAKNEIYLALINKKGTQLSACSETIVISSDVKTSIAISRKDNTVRFYKNGNIIKTVEDFEGTIQNVLVNNYSAVPGTVIKLDDIVIVNNEYLVDGDSYDNDNYTSLLTNNAGVMSNGTLYTTY